MDLNISKQSKLIVKVLGYILMLNLIGYLNQRDTIVRAHTTLELIPILLVPEVFIVLMEHGYVLVVLTTIVLYTELKLWTVTVYL